MFKSAVIVLVRNGSNEENDRINTYLSSQLSLINFQTIKTVVANEEEKELTEKLTNFSKECDIILLVGNPNNILFKSLSDVCYNETKSHEEITKKYTTDKDFMLPSHAKLLAHPALSFPVIHLQRIFILKRGIVEIQFSHALQSHLQKYTSEMLFTKTIRVHLNGNSAKILDNLQNGANVKLHVEDSTSILTVASAKLEAVVGCEKLLKNELGENFFESSIFSDSLKEIYESDDDNIRNSIRVIKESFYLYGPENIFLSFNGGKDCTVLLHLVYAVLKTNFPDFKTPIVCLYVKGNEAFEEQDNFISLCETYYNLKIFEYTVGIKSALQEILSKEPHFKAVLMGTRRTDPYSQHLNVFQMTDADWPQIMRISPLLDWRYTDIWDYLLLYKVPYCKLYDLGYTSLGSSANTIRNPALTYYDAEKQETRYLPAYKLLNEIEERSGRNVRK
ncbi:unnamed protein product [Phyllotreta striolata]|uniref:FAD synthase n=1 Tax=Phyllotreta striolata TaxID=444603 RepID=A0A9N9XQC5_PHYSR|nr:unnamed protein product [Phyllotreta striolata]